MRLLKKPFQNIQKPLALSPRPDAAALRDVLTTLKRRNPAIKVIIYPTPVQGKGAAALIAKAIHAANKRAECDTLIICRGGGSMEDLWQFNEEIVARAIDDSAIPTISGVGHETDFTICDFVADVRAATPTAAAELACMDVTAKKNQLAGLQNQLKKQITFTLNQQMQKLDFLARRLISPSQQIALKTTQINQLQHRMDIGLQGILKLNNQHILSLKNSLAQLNPHNVLARGYAIVQADNGELLVNSAQLVLNQSVNITLSKGNAKANIVEIVEEKNAN